MANITITPYMAGMVNHAMNNETTKIPNSTYFARDTLMEIEKRLRRREQYCARRNRETTKERASRLEARRARERHQNTMMLTEQQQILLQWKRRGKRQARNHSVANT